MRLIDADVIIARCETVEKNNELSATEANRLGWLKEMIQMMPTIDHVRHGRWIDSSNGWMCTCCKMDTSKDWNYCPNCGAKMDGGEEKA